MVILYHCHNKIQEVVTTKHQKIDVDKNVTLVKALHNLANQFPNEIIVWCHLDYKDYLDLKVIKTIFHHNKIMLSYHPGDHQFLDERIGYVEESVFININKKVSYPTWQMSSAVGAIHATVLLEIKNSIALDSNFDYYLNSLAKLAMPLGLFCYSEPRLLSGEMKLTNSKADMFTLFKFVKQHYKMRWVFLLVLNIWLYEKKIMLLPFLYTFCFGKRTNISINLDAITVQSSKKGLDKTTIDVIIPTIGRKSYLYDVLCDLRNQTQLPKHVIVVEQNPVEESVSELDYLISESWPFKILHTFTHQTGACHARNIALKQVKSDWVFLADDDIVIENNFLAKINHTINQFPYKAFTFRCYLKGETKVFNKIIQWGTFGSGCSIVNMESLNGSVFSEAYEHGFGEDSDFGMQLRNKGIDVIYLPEPSILHLKASIGGFRTKPKLLWQDEDVQPKPSPTVMLFQLLHKTKTQQLGYKTLLFLKYYNKQSIKKPFKYYRAFKKQWSQSLNYANQLKNNF
ncbi:glycosyltransferase family 2 protein [Thalassobellus suaedae]|uniref:Glycosyltransferase n=1 Tax=Thalassobellus suaedae TaxID=3074124 RepID=A0ABY9Y0B7_9FLAO|nr:glycosyltransferase [Flavobacteriaceae bacterium HL-DH10]